MRVSVVTVGILIFGFCSQADEFIYWTDGSDILRTSLDGSSTVVLVPGSDQIRGVAVDEVGEKIYWTLVTLNTIRRANLDGTHVEDVLTAADGVDRPSGIALDPSSDKLYWSNLGGMSSPDGTINSASLAGANPEILVTGTIFVHTMTLDLVDNRMYWTDSMQGSVQRAFLDGTGVEFVVNNLFMGESMALSLDTTGRKVYWSSWISDLIRRADMDGLNSNVEIVVETGGDTGGLFVNRSANQIYWVEPLSINRSALDGSSKAVVLGGLSAADALVIASAEVAGGAPMPASSSGSDLLLFLSMLCVGGIAIVYLAGRSSA